MLGKLTHKAAKSAEGKTKHLVALDIGTEYVKALIGRVKGENIEIIGVGRQKQDLADMHGGAIADIAGVVDNCDAALAQAEKMAGVDARDVVIGIAGELVKGTTRTINYQRADSKKPIDEEELERIIKKVQHRAYENAKKQLAWELGKKNVDVRMVNSALVSIEIDGYKVTNPIGFQGKDVAIQLFTAYAPMIHIGALERTVSELDLDLIAVAAEPFAVARSVIGTDASSSLSAILIDIGGGTSDIAVVNDGGVEGTKMFGIGGRSFTRSVATEAGVEFSEAEEMKIGLDGGKLSKKQDQDTRSAIDKTLKVWSSGIELALSDFHLLDHLPNRVLLCGGGASLDPLVENLKGGDWYKELPFTKKPAIQHIKPSQVVGIVDKTDTITDHTYITAMGLLRVGIDTVAGSENSSNSIKEKINKLLSI